MGQRSIRVMALALLVICVLAGGAAIMARTKGEFVLPTEKAYVNCTMARGLFFYKVWGVSKHQFMPAATSLLYPILLGPVFFIFGSHLVIPVLVNLAAAIWLLIAMHRWMMKKDWVASQQVWLLMVAAGLLPLLVLTGTEYVVYLLLAFLFWTNSYNSWERNSTLPWTCYLYVTLLVSIRYEGIVLVLLMSIYFIARQRNIDALKLLLFGAMPIVIYGIICRIHEDAFVPTPMVEIKGADWWLSQLAVVLLIIVANATPQYRFAGVLLLPMALTGVVLFCRASDDSLSIYQTQYPVAGFLRRCYYRRPLATNHLGVMSYFTLGNKITLRDSSISDSVMRMKGIALVILSNDRLQALVHPEWSKVASWQTRPEGYTFYIQDSALVKWVRKSMDEYRYFLPQSIHIEYD